MASDLQIDMQTAMTQTKALPSIPRNASLSKLRETAQDFEAVFLSQMMKPMFEGIQTDGPFGGGQAEQMYRDLMVDEYGKSIAKAGGIGIADAVFKEMLKMQEVQ
ncbi:MAG: rod-binding protein [Magnetovibrio sp.]|nr:rod-binding protein [Magnetovibrio sp.]